MVAISREYDPYDVVDRLMQKSDEIQLGDSVRVVDVDVPLTDVNESLKVEVTVEVPVSREDLDFILGNPR